jgi:hypothetical protein
MSAGSSTQPLTSKRYFSSSSIGTTGAPSALQWGSKLLLSSWCVELWIFAAIACFC